MFFATAKYSDGHDNQASSPPRASAFFSKRPILFGLRQRRFMGHSGSRCNRAIILVALWTGEVLADDNRLLEVSTGTRNAAADTCGCRTWKPEYASGVGRC